MKPPFTDEERCQVIKRSKFGRLRCCLHVYHQGECNFVVRGVVPDAPNTHRRSLTKAEKEMKRWKTPYKP